MLEKWLDGRDIVYAYFGAVLSLYALCGATDATKFAPSTVLASEMSAHL